MGDRLDAGDRGEVMCEHSWFLIDDFGPLMWICEHCGNTQDAESVQPSTSSVNRTVYMEIEVK